MPNDLYRVIIKHKKHKMDINFLFVLEQKL